MHIISGILKNRKIFAPKGLNTRPTSNKLREAVFNILQSKVDQADFLDLFAGSGSMGLEAISREAKSSTFIDNSKECIRCIKNSIESMNLFDKSKVFHGDFLMILKKMDKQKRKFDIIYADPPYSKRDEKTDFSNQLLAIIDNSDLLQADGYFFIEESKNVSMKDDVLLTLRLKKKRLFGDTVLLIYQKRQIDE